MITQEFYERPAKEVAIDLLGRDLMTWDETIFGVEIRETAAFEGENSRTGEGYYNSPGEIYPHHVSHGNWVLAVSTESSEDASVVAFRAGEEVEPVIDNCRQRIEGPSLLFDYMNADSDYDGMSLTDGDIWVEGYNLDPDLVETEVPDSPQNCVGIYSV